MSSDTPPGLGSDLLDDFYAECDELLTSSRSALVQLEASIGNPAAAAPQVEALFRHVHSIKGNAAIVGLRPGEQLAHAMEDLLRGLAKRKFALTLPMVESLLSATQRLGQIVASHRLAKAAPETGGLLAQLARLTEAGAPAPAETTASTEAPSPAASAVARGLKLWRATFTPSPDLDRRGVNVSSVRTRLAAMGQIVGATPVVRNKGVLFEFVVALASAPEGGSEWDADGVRFDPAPSAAAPEDPAPTDAAPALEELSLAPSHMVRVDLARLDDLGRILGELVILRSRLEERIGRLAGDSAPLKEVNSAMARALRDMHEAVARVRLIPIAEVFTRMPFVVRELAKGSGKKARVVLEGHQTVVDKYLVERLKEPLLHFVRNAFVHGIEPAAERAAAGKPEEATIVLRATSAGETVVIQIRDDGRGVDAAAVARRAAALGLEAPERPADGELLDLLCLPGFSTRDDADLAAGRGVGMAVAAKIVGELGGRLTMETSPGAGTQFTLRLPLTLSVVAAFIAAADDQLCAIPQNSVDEIVQVATEAVRTIRQTEVMPYRGGLLPLVRLRALYRRPPSGGPLLTVMVLRGERGAVGLVVDAARTQREVVVRPLADPLLRVPGIAGATELGDGRPILILDPASITNGVVRPPEGDSSEPVPLPLAS